MRKSPLPRGYQAKQGNAKQHPTAYRSGPEASESLPFGRAWEGALGPKASSHIVPPYAKSTTSLLRKSSVTFVPTPTSDTSAIPCPSSSQMRLQR